MAQITRKVLDALELEERLFLDLVDLLRSPETLLQLTGARQDMYDAEGDFVYVEPRLDW